jgi:hypothetical protein
MNFARIAVLAAVARNSGKVFRKATATTCSEGASPGRTVPDPGAEESPDRFGCGRGEDLKQALDEEPKLDVAMVGRDFPADGVPEGIRFVVQVLVAADAW